MYHRKEWIRRRNLWSWFNFYWCWNLWEAWQESLRENWKVSLLLQRWETEIKGEVSTLAHKDSDLLYSYWCHLTTIFWWGRSADCINENQLTKDCNLEDAEDVYRYLWVSMWIWSVGCTVYWIEIRIITHFPLSIFDYPFKGISF